MGTYNNPRKQVKIIIKKHLEPIGGKMFTTTIKKLVTHIRKWKLAICTLFIFCSFFCARFLFDIIMGIMMSELHFKTFFFVYLVMVEIKRKLYID